MFAAYTRPLCLVVNTFLLSRLLCFVDASAAASGGGGGVVAAWVGECVAVLISASET